MSDRLTDIADTIDELLHEYEMIIHEDMIKNNDNKNKIFAIVATYIPNERTWIKILR